MFNFVLTVLTYARQYRENTPLSQSNCKLFVLKENFILFSGIPRLTDLINFSLSLTAKCNLLCENLTYLHEKLKQKFLNSDFEGSLALE